MKIVLIIIFTFFSLCSSYSIGQEVTENNGSFDQRINWSDVDNSLMELVYVDSGQSILEYKKVFIKQPEVTFQTNWINKFGDEKTRSYRERVAREYAELLTESIRNKFSSEMNLEITEQRSDDVLVIMPKVFDLYIDYPDIGGIQDVIIASAAGYAKMELVIYSPKTESVLGMFSDKRSTKKPGIVLVSKPRVINTRAFSQLFNVWVDDIAMAIDL